LAAADNDAPEGGRVSINAMLIFHSVPAFLAHFCVCCGYFCQQSLPVSGNPGPDEENAFSSTYKAGFRPNFSIPLIAHQSRMNVDRQWKSCPVIFNCLSLDCEDRCRYVGHPYHRPSLDGAKGIEDARCNRHSAYNAIRIAFLNGKFDIAGSSGGLYLSL
jgi:hypothetical protein